MVDTVGIDLFLGLDLGKEFHHAHGLTGQGKTVHDKRLPNTESRLRELSDKLNAKFGTVLVIVDQVANIGALPLTVARATGCRVAYLP
ncbi:transposase, partial [Streptomyces sp. SM11]|uniref:IS110 family transposase n=1 Tax=Streptomyces sp. SM11 TaxID=565557 RepID=UPI0011B09CED